MKIDRYERIFLYTAAVVLAAFFGAILFSVGEAGIHLPTKEDTIDPAEVRSTAPFDNPGVFETGKSGYAVKLPVFN